MGTRRSTRSAHARPGRPSPPPRGRLLTGILAAVVLCLVYLGGMNRTLDLAQRLDGLEQEREALQRRVDRLSLDLAERARSDRVVELARLRLGMEFPGGPVEVLAVAPATSRPVHSVWTYMENALVMAVEGLERRLSSTAGAAQPAPPDSSGSP